MIFLIVYPTLFCIRNLALSCTGNLAWNSMCPAVVIYVGHMTNHTPIMMLSCSMKFNFSSCETYVALTKAKSHLSFVSSCKEKGQAPKGLQVNVRCSAFMADMTNIQKHFTETTKEAETGYVTITMMKW